MLKQSTSNITFKSSNNPAADFPSAGLCCEDVLGSSFCSPAANSNFTHDGTTPETTSFSRRESCPRHIYEPEYRFSPTGKNNTIHGLLWRPSVWSRGGTHRRKNMGDFLHDGAAAAARKSCVLDARPKPAGNTKAPEPGCGWRRWGVFA